MWRRLAIPFAAATLFMVTACSSGGANLGNPTSPPTATPDVTSQQNLPYAGAPKVSTPLPESIFTGDPCADTLTPDQVLKAVGKPSETVRKDQDSIGPGCEWFNTSTTGQVIMRYATKLQGGLSAIYENVKPKAEIWKPIDLLQGFPAVAYVSPSGGSPDKFCQISVGATDNTTIEVSMFLSLNSQGKKDPCESAKNVTDLIMTSLRAKAGV
ncbi:DUF3558 domain-containing protein [Amycolatopsis sp. NPDC052450]|uniref:DUF3558 domain-containing protein n=1 Tax=Amycolatopsis sp. NPDC052450 TaxID=3363937 RepID=UPI0037C54EEB